MENKLALRVKDTKINLTASQMLQGTAIKANHLLAAV